MKLRGTVLSTLCKINPILKEKGIQNLNDELDKLFDELAKNPNNNSIPNDIKNAIIKNKVMKINTKEELESLIQL